MHRAWVSVAFLLAFAPVALAQGGGVSQTGAINGRVTDARAGVLPGVTVTATSPAQMAAQSTLTNAAGFYHFPALAPGTYALRYERDQFSAVTRSGIDVPLGFTATVDVTLSLAPIQAAAIVVSRIDTTTARVQTNFGQEQLAAMPNARDLWALFAVTPGVQMGRWDIGGNRSGNQTSYRAYGYGGQDQQARILVEGINTTDGRSANGFFQDYGSFDEVIVSALGNGAEVPHPGVTAQMLTKSGSNLFHSELYADYGSDDTQQRIDGSIEAGGPLRSDALWYYAAYRQLESSIDQLNLQIGRRFETSLYNASGKATYRLGLSNTFVGYYQWGKKQQPYRAWNAGYTFFDVADTTRQDDGSSVWKGEWNRASNHVLIDARFGGFGYYLPLLGNSDEPFRQDTGTRVSSGGDRRTQTDRDRRQLTAVATTFHDRAAGMRHALKTGVEMNLETAWTGFERTRAGDVEHIFNNGRATQVILGFPTADGQVGQRSARDRLLSIAKMDQWSGFISDEWRVHDALTLNLGVRFDHYRSHTPEQRQLPFTNGPVTIAAETFPRQTFFRWSSLVPRVAAIYQIDGDGHTVVKASYGYFKHNPSFDIANAANPNQGTKTITYAWTDRNGDRLYQTGEEGGVVVSNLANAVQVDPETRQPYTHEVIASLERQVGGAARVRAGVVYKTNDDLWQPYRPLRPIDGYTTPFTIRDSGADGGAGTPDDRDLVFYGTPNGQLGAATTVIQSVPAFGRYTALESSFERRLRDRWSLAAGFSYSWTHEHNNNYIGNNVSPVANPGYPNSPNEMLYTNGTDGAHRFTIWDVKARATWEAPWGLRFTPMLRAQAGQPYGRVLQVTAPASCACFFNGLVLVEPLDARRMDTVAVFDLRTEAMLPVGRHRAGLFVDVFNAFNSSAADVISYTTGPAFEQPTSVIASRFVRVGVRMQW